MNDPIWTDLQRRWQSLDPGVQFAIEAVAIMLAALFVGQIAAAIARRRLRAAHFDQKMRRPWNLPAASAKTDLSPQPPTILICWLIRLTVWGFGLWIVARLGGWIELADGLAWGGGRVWLFAIVILIALYLSRIVSERLIEVIQASPLKETFDPWQIPTGARESKLSGPAVLLALAIDGAVVLMAMLIAADIARLNVAGEAMSAAWHLMLHLLTAGIALVIGWIGARAVRTYATPENAASKPGFAVYASGCVMGGAVLLAILLLAGKFTTYFGLIVLVVLLMLIWPAQRWLPDIYAGMLIRAQGIKEVRIDNVTVPVATVGWIRTELTHPDGVQTRSNRTVLEAHMAGPKSESPDKS